MADSIATAESRALGTSLRVVVTRPDRLAIATAAVDGVVLAIDEACSRFRDDSELARLNASAGIEVIVSPLLVTALGAALRGARLSDGAVDPTIGTALRRIGYDLDFDLVPREGGPIPVVIAAVPGWHLIRLNEATRTVRAPAGVEIDLGSTAKALAADLAAAAALDAMEGARDGGGVLVSLGGDIAVAGQPPAGGWHIQIADSHEAPIDKTGETIAIRSGGVATSSTIVRRWTRGGVTLHHIIDPATGRPADGPWRTATVVAATCVDANIGATAAIVRGTAAADWLASRNLPARLVGQRGDVYRLPGWPQTWSPPGGDSPSKF